jgi:hypothetical protein
MAGDTAAETGADLLNCLVIFVPVLQRLAGTVTR